MAWQMIFRHPVHVSYDAHGALWLLLLVLAHRWLDCRDLAFRRVLTCVFFCVHVYARFDAEQDEEEAQEEGENGNVGTVMPQEMQLYSCCCYPWSSLLPCKS